MITKEKLVELFNSTNDAEPLSEGWAGLERFARAVELEARREGWEQAKREAQSISFAYACHKGIAAMTYKEKCCEQTWSDNP